MSFDIDNTEKSLIARGYVLTDRAAKILGGITIQHVARMARYGELPDARRIGHIWHIKVQPDGTIKRLNGRGRGRPKKS